MSSISAFRCLRSAVFIAVEIGCIALFLRAVWIWSALLAGA